MGLLKPPLSFQFRFVHKQVEKLGSCSQLVRLEHVLLTNHNLISERVRPLFPDYYEVAVEPD